MDPPSACEGRKSTPAGKDGPEGENAQHRRGSSGGEPRGKELKSAEIAAKKFSKKTWRIPLTKQSKWSMMAKPLARKVRRSWQWSAGA